MLLKLIERCKRLRRTQERARVGTGFHFVHDEGLLPV
jgi:hypothetical protein